MGYGLGFWLFECHDLHVNLTYKTFSQETRAAIKA
jgi:hypothetical protein